MQEAGSHAKQNYILSEAYKGRTDSSSKQLIKTIIISVINNKTTYITI